MSTDLTQLGQYRIEEEIGRGGMATVYRAFHLPLQRYVALKVLDPVISRNPEFQQRFEQEARVAAQLSHPNIVPIYDLGTADEREFIAMQLIEGTTLETRLRETGRVPTRHALEVIGHIAEGLAHAHQHGVIHRDVKPSNILLRPDDWPVLSDFGIARAVEGMRLTMSFSVMGTPRYMSPEQAMSQEVDHRTDVYSLGVVMYEMLVGQPPFNAPNTPSLLYMHVHEPPPPLSEARPDLSIGVRELVSRCLAKAPAERFQSALQLAASCRALAAIPGIDADEEPSTGAWAPIRETPTSASRPAPSMTSVPNITPAPAPSVPTPSVAPPAPPPTQSAPAAAQPAPTTPEPAAPTSRGGPPLALLGAGVGVLLLLVLGWIGFTRMQPAAPAEERAATAIPAAASTPVAAAVPPTSPAAPPTSPPAAATSAPASPAVTDAASAARFTTEAMAALGRRDFAAALEQATTGLREAPADPALLKTAVQARMGLGAELWGRGALEDALRHYLTVRVAPLRGATSRTELREADAAAAYLWGALTEPTDRPLAAAEFGKAYRIDPGFRDVRQRYYDANLALARQFQTQGDTDTATRYATTARSVFPDRQEVNDLLQSLTSATGR